MLLGIVRQLHGMVAVGDLVDGLLQLLLGGIGEVFLAYKFHDLGQDRARHHFDDGGLDLAGDGIVRFDLALFLAGGGAVLHLLHGVGEDLGLTLGIDHGGLAQLGLHVLKRHGHGRIAAGNALLA